MNFPTSQFRYTQTRSIAGAANVLDVDSAAVPSGRLWLILAASIDSGDVAARTFSFSWSLGGILVALRTERAVIADNQRRAVTLTEHVPLWLPAGSFLRASVDVLTVGANIVLRFHYLEFGAGQLLSPSGEPGPTPPGADELVGRPGPGPRGF